MQSINEKIIQEISELVKNGKKYNSEAETAGTHLGGEKVAEITEWVTRVGQLIRKIYGENSQHYEAYFAATSVQGFYNLHSNNYRHISQVLGVALAIQSDIKNGTLDDITRIAQADLFSDFLEMAEHLLEEGYKDAAAVIIGSVLEDNLRKLCVKNAIPTSNAAGKNLTMDPLNILLSSKGIYSKGMQKQITSWAHIRNKAAHGEYSEYDSQQVKIMLLFSKQFTSDYIK